MKAYPVILSPCDEGGYVVTIPDFNINTQGDNVADAIMMARDAIGVVGIDMEDEKHPLPEPSFLAEVKSDNSDGIVTLVDVDFAEYRRKNDMRSVKKNCTLPSWLAVEAEKAGVNFSATLQAALKRELRLVGHS